MFPAVVRHLVERRLEDFVQLAGPERSLLSSVIFNRVKINPVEFHVRGVPIERIPNRLNDVIFSPRFQYEWPGTDVVPRTRPFRIALIDSAKFQDRARVHREPSSMKKRRKEIGCRPDQFELEDPIVERLYPYLTKIGGPPFGVFSGSLEDVKRIDV